MNTSIPLSLQEEFEDEVVIPLATTELNKPAPCYTILARPAGSIASGKFAALLKFTLKEIDPSTGAAEEDGYEDEYELEDVVVTPADYVKPTKIANFRAAWEQLDADTETTDDYGLGQRSSLEEAIEAVIETLGMSVCDGTDAVPPNARSHQVALSGTFLGEELCLVRLSFGIDSKKNVAMKVIARGETADVAEAVHLIITEA